MKYEAGIESPTGFRKVTGQHSVSLFMRWGDAMEKLGLFLLLVGLAMFLFAVAAVFRAFSELANSSKNK